MGKSPLLILLLFTSFTSIAQDSLLHFNVEVQTIYTTQAQLPFWLRSNKFGSIPESGASSSLIGRFQRDYKENSKKLLEWGVGFEGRMNVGKEVRGRFIEAYGKLKLGVFQLKVGRSKQIVGLVGDSTLSSGSFSISGNALGVPQVHLSIPGYYSLPFFNSLFAFKGGVSHGWLGEVPFNSSRRSSVTTYFHESYLYGRFGRPNWKLALYGGLNHQAFWGNYAKTWPVGLFKLSFLQEIWAVATSQVVGNSKVGNHLGSLDIGFDYRFNDLILKGYRQNIYDIGAIGHLANIKDGLNGLTLINNRRSFTDDFVWKTILFEVLYTKSQAGEIGKVIPSGAEDYYNNYQYPLGWSYRQLNLGSAFLTNRNDAKEDLVRLSNDFVVNNRIITYHFGFKAATNALSMATMLSYSRNFGTYKTSGVSYRSLGKEIIIPERALAYKPQSQLSSSLSVSKRMRANVSAGLLVAADYGSLLNNSFGGLAFLSKSF
jgi:hypothetical protein